MNRNDKHSKDGRNDNGRDGNDKDKLQKEQEHLRHEQLRKMTEGGNDSKYRPKRVMEKMGWRAT